jgi:hypothetical protein
MINRNCELILGSGMSLTGMGFINVRFAKSAVLDNVWG